MRLFGILLLVFFLPVKATAQQYILSAENPVFKLGQAGRILVTVLNDTAKPVEAPAQLAVRVGRKNEGLLSKATRSRDFVAPGSFRQIVYFLNVAESFKPSTQEILLVDHVAPGLLVKFKASHPEDAPLDVPILADTEDAKGRVLLDGLKTYEPIYFLAGFGPTEAKFQISLKYQLFNEDADWVKRNRWLRGFHLAYTQVAFWDLDSPSKPFEDTNFKPEVFYGLDGLKWDFLPKGSEVDVQLGFLHESNGRDGDNSRSLNILYQRATYRQQLRGDWFAAVTGDFWTYIGSLEDNPDIDDYRGHSSLRLTAGHDEGLQLSAYRRGKIGSGKGSYLFDLTFPLTKPGETKSLNFNLHAQLFTGYGENLLTYKEKETRLRIGLGIHR